MASALENKTGAKLLTQLDKQKLKFSVFVKWSGRLFNYIDR